MRPRAKPVVPTRAERDSWDGVDRELFESLRALRREIALERGVPAYVIFSNASLRDMARLRPVTTAQFLQVHGVGEKKARTLGPRFIAHIKANSAPGGRAR